MQILLYLHTAFGAKIHDIKKKGRSKLCECVFYATERVDASARNVICLNIYNIVLLFCSIISFELYALVLLLLVMTLFQPSRSGKWDIAAVQYKTNPGGLAIRCY